ncbi:GFA family protein [Niveibacterium sp. 24ML]|uniref:GFA family protein n=1 Tax=Niveibacterium sp. 24ML TaxID=2985512 RepID=UPI0022716E26|nr:GFA family protein [Niveibacterium sp. 24ML]MCX9157316.1 GFA family protein [Niveibacterium sp. 24ML]
MEHAGDFEGGCLCGAIRYRVRLDKAEGYYCHCRMCQLAFGSVFAPWINVAVADLVWLGDLPKRYASSRIAERGFCGQCGTPLSFHFNDSPRMDLSIGSFDQPDRIRPVSHFAIETRVATWHVPDGLPEERAADFAALNARWQKAYGDAAPGLATVRAAQGQA